MTREEAEAIEYIQEWLKDEYALNSGDRKVLNMAIEALKKEPCEDCISRQAVLEIVERVLSKGDALFEIEDLPPVTPQPKTGHCKECKYFEHDSVETVYGIPLIVHEICSKWGNGCKTREDGYCFLFEPQESEVEE